MIGIIQNVSPRETSVDTIKMIRIIFHHDLSIDINSFYIMIVKSSNRNSDFKVRDIYFMLNTVFKYAEFQK